MNFKKTRIYTSIIAAIIVVLVILSGLFLGGAFKTGFTILNPNGNIPKVYGMFGDTVKNVWTDYQNGKYGSELYYLSSGGGGWGGRGDIAVYKNADSVQIKFYQFWGRYKTRKLTNDEVNKFEIYINQNKIDSLPDCKNTRLVMDGSEYQYMHFSRTNQATFYMNNPDINGAGKVYDRLVKEFFDLTKTGDFDVQYSSETTSEDIKILIKSENKYVESVWKNGEDFRVLIKDEENSDYEHGICHWYKFENGIIGERTDEPEGVTMANPWLDIPDSYIFEEHLNNYPWQAQWRSYLVCPLDDGLYLAKKGEKPKLITKGQYAAPVVIPNTNWVVCSKADKGWANPSKVVKINLQSFKETVIDLPPADSIEPVVFIKGKLLIIREGVGYLYDVTSNSLKKVSGDFGYFGYGFAGRFLQKTSEPDTYYLLESQYTMGTFNMKTFTYKKLATPGVFIYDYTHMWVDEDESVVYVTVEGDLLAVPVKI